LEKKKNNYIGLSVNTFIVLVLVYWPYYFGSHWSPMDDSALREFFDDLFELIYRISENRRGYLRFDEVYSVIAWTLTFIALLFVGWKTREWSGNKVLKLMKNFHQRV
jgi:hypothetical protein